ncbi:hypothetical protein V8F33_005290 [Rhypophila sp. PSN 637]
MGTIGPERRRWSWKVGLLEEQAKRKQNTFVNCNKTFSVLSAVCFRFLVFLLAQTTHRQFSCSFFLSEAPLPSWCRLGLVRAFATRFALFTLISTAWAATCTWSLFGAQYKLLLSLTRKPSFFPRKENREVGVDRGEGRGDGGKGEKMEPGTQLDLGDSGLVVEDEEAGNGRSVKKQANKKNTSQEPGLPFPLFAGWPGWVRCGSCFHLLGCWVLGGGVLGSWPASPMAGAFWVCC